MSRAVIEKPADTAASALLTRRPHELTAGVSTAKRNGPVPPEQRDQPHRRVRNGGTSRNDLIALTIGLVVGLVGWASGGRAVAVPVGIVAVLSAQAAVVDALYTMLDDDAITFVEQAAAAGPEDVMQRRFTEAASALDACPGGTFEVEDGTVSVTNVDDASLPDDAVLLQMMFTHNNGSETPHHVAYARVGPVLSVLLFDGIDTHQVLTYLHSAVSRIADATGSPGPPETVAPPAAQESHDVPEGFVEQEVPERSAAPRTECTGLATAGRAPAPTDSELPALRQPEPQWVTESSKGFYQPMAARDGLIVVMAGTLLTALRAEDGETVWERDVEPDPSLLALGDSLFVASSADELMTLAALDPSSGEPRWASAFAFSGVYWDVIASDDAVSLHVVPDEPGYGETWAVDPDTGVVRWRTDGRLEAAGSGVVVVGGGCRLSAFDAVSGAERWTVGIDSDSSFEEIVDGDLFVALHRRLTAIDLTTGESRWSVGLSIDGRIGMAGDSDQLFVTQVELGTGDDFVVTALNAVTGTIVWSARVVPPAVEQGDFGIEIGSATNVDGGVVAVSTGSSVVRFDAATGAVMSIDDMLAPMHDLEPDNIDLVTIVMLDGAAFTMGAEHILRTS